MNIRVEIYSAALAITLLTLSTPTSAYWQGNTLPVQGHPGCPGKLMVSQGLIIDIVTSRKNGVSLLEGGRESSFSSCVTKCCQMSGCDLVVYKTEGVSSTGRNCYYIHCGKPESCRMVADEGFMSATVVGDGESQGSGREGSQVGGKGNFSPAPVPSPTTPMPSPSLSGDSEPQLSTGPQASAEPSSPGTTGQPSEPPTSNAPLVVHSPTVDTSETPTPPDLVATEEEGETDGTKEGSENQKPTDVVSGPTDPGKGGVVNGTTLPQGDGSGQGGINDTDSVGKQDEHYRPVITTHETRHGRKKSCDEDGCEGKGVIVVAVISSVALLITIVLSVVLFRYLAKRRRNKRFRNVDYLINGMYT